MKVYCVAMISGKFMIPAEGSKIYKSKAAAKKARDKLNEGRISISKYVVLEADNWHETEMA